MDGLEKEHLLHKIVASSAFLFALCILPVAQYYLVTNQLPANSKNAPQIGQVEGVSTDKSIIQNDVPAPSPVMPVQNSNYTGLSCIQKKNKEIADLTSWDTGYKQHLLSVYETTVAPFQNALKQTIIAQNSEAVASFNQKIDAAYQTYLGKLNAEESAVATQKAEFESVVCPSN
jgi:hypothetical protein